MCWADGVERRVPGVWHMDARQRRPVYVVFLPGVRAFPCPYLISIINIARFFCQEARCVLQTSCSSRLPQFYLLSDPPDSSITHWCSVFLPPPASRAPLWHHNILLWSRISSNLLGTQAAHLDDDWCSFVSLHAYAVVFLTSVSLNDSYLRVCCRPDWHRGG